MCWSNPSATSTIPRERLARALARPPQTALPQNKTIVYGRALVNHLQVRTPPIRSVGESKVSPVSLETVDRSVISCFLASSERLISGRLLKWPAADIIAF
jgi:hypothetical protein